ncbi:MAG: hypothetical protein QM760_17200 [Nibricoccus sp.]
MITPRHALLASVLFASLATHGTAGDNAALSRGKQLLDDSKPAAALIEFQNAAQADPANYEGYFYTAIASYRLGNLAAAEEYARLALEKAPEAEKSRVQEMLGVIGEKQSYERLEAEGDAALAKGLRAKAAESYRKAYLLFPKDGRLGLKAASLYADNLRKPLDAAILWQKVASQADEQSRDAARQELTQRHAALDKIFTEELKRAKTTQRRVPLETLNRLIEAFPDRAEPLLEASAFYDGKKNYEKAVEHLSRACAIGVDVNDVQFRQEFMWAVNSKESTAMATFIEEAFGAETVANMRNMPWGPNTGTPEEKELFKQAVEHGASFALMAMGSYFEHKEAGNNPAEAAVWYQKAADAGNAYGYVELGALYLYGKLGKDDFQTAASYFEKAAALGDPFGRWHMGRLLAEGKGVTKNEAEAERIWTEEASQGESLSLAAMAEFCREHGRYEESMKWARILSAPEKALNNIGWFELGMCYRDAPPPIRNIAEARRCLEKAVELKHYTAKDELAKLPRS